MLGLEGIPSIKQTREEWGFTQNEFSEIMKHIQVLGPAIQKVLFETLTDRQSLLTCFQAIQRHLHQNQGTPQPIPTVSEPGKKPTPVFNGVQQVQEQILPRPEIKPKPSAVQS